MLKKLLADENGSIIIILTLGITAFIGFVALVADVGLLYFNDSEITNAVDAAVLAGAQELPYNPSEAEAKARHYGELNGLDGAELAVEVFSDNKKIKAHYEKEVNLLFAKVLNIHKGKVGHTAVAEVAPVIGLDGAAPLGIQKHEFEFGKQYTLKVGAGDTDFLEGETSPGWFGALALGGPGASRYEDNLTYGYQGSLKIGDIIDIQTGNISGPTKKAIDYRISEDKHVPYCTVDNFVRDCSRLIKVPVIEPVAKK
ncbi:MAG: pilus assembly protein TadG-related protein, partial [Peptococcales bacterium]